MCHARVPLALGRQTLSFTDFNLHKDFITSIKEAGYQSPTPLQSQLIPLVAEGKSALVLSQSAAGKTGAFLIPAINYILENPDQEKRGARILILTSRRDRVSQINYTIKRLSRDHNMRFGFIVSGRPYQTQMRLMRRPLDIMIATPGRLNDLMENKKADFSQLEILIIDDLSSIYQKNLQGLVESILKQVNENCLSFVFVNNNDEATDLAKSLFPDSTNILIDEDDRETDSNELKSLPADANKQKPSHQTSNSNKQTHTPKEEDSRPNLLDSLPKELMTQHVYVTDDYTHKIALMDHFLDEFSGEPSVIYTSTDKVAKTLQENLTNHGHAAELLNDLSTEELSGGNIDTLIISDQDKNTKPSGLPSGYDNHLIHFDLPFKTINYIKRLGNHDQNRETAAILIVDGRNYSELKQIEKTLGATQEQHKVPGLEPLLPFVNKSKPKPSNRKPQNRNNAGKNQNTKNRNETNKNQQRKSSNNNSDNKTKRQRKGPFGRLNGGVHRKQSGTSNESGAPNKNSGRKRSGPQNNNQHKRKPKIGVSSRGTSAPTSDRAWQSDFAEPKERQVQSKRVVIRYKDKKRSLLSEKTDDEP